MGVEGGGVGVEGGGVGEEVAYPRMRIMRIMHVSRSAYHGVSHSAYHAYHGVSCNVSHSAYHGVSQFAYHAYHAFRTCDVSQTYLCVSRVGSKGCSITSVSCTYHDLRIKGVMA